MKKDQQQQIDFLESLIVSATSPDAAAKQVLEWVQEQSTEWGVEQSHIFTTGFYVMTLQKSFQALYPHGSKEYFAQYLKENLLPLHWDIWTNYLNQKAPFLRP
ncbi:hypothetical protein [Rufibacter sp. XAAS-G3-1]|uniref:hypothetical protein n=1 Tax=Rufibacter sp. XAAS-G3-1 TaxID=2729134 RepID=UPI0015E7107A|nr:hypothetical protein [Rufibacter sp. XAAS-G3-1]